MTNQEINEAVARELGLDKCQIDGGYERIRVGDGELHFLPAYCTSLPEAWKIIKSTPELFFELKRFPSQNVWRVQLDLFTFVDETPAMAICGAYLAYRKQFSDVKIQREEKP